MYRDFQFTIYKSALIFHLLPIILLLLDLLFFESGSVQNTINIIILIFISIPLFLFHLGASFSRNIQGYILISMIIYDLLLVFAGLYLSSSGSFSSLITFFSMINVLGIISLLLATVIIKKLLVWIYQWIHAETYELKYNNSVTITNRTKKQDILEFNDFFYSEFNRFTKVQALWAIIPFSILPFLPEVIHLSVILKMIKQEYFYRYSS